MRDQELQTLVLDLQEENISLKERYERLLEQFKLARQRQFSSSSESSEQLCLQFDEVQPYLVKIIPLR